MITLSIIAYVIISLLIARHYYWNSNVDTHRGQINSCYLNGKKSLKHGFLTLPVLAVSLYMAVMVIIGFCTLVVKIISWIFVNMP